MYSDVLQGIFIPFFGTAVGSAAVLFMKRSPRDTVQLLLTGTAAGVMTAAAIWSLILPAIELCSADMGALAFIPAAIGFLAGNAFLMLTEYITSRLTAQTDEDRGRKLMIFAVTLHNIPEGMAVGIVYAGLICGAADITPASAMALAAGIAIQNIPEGAIISLPMRAAGSGRLRSFAGGTLSGAVEPAAALITAAVSGIIVPAMPYLLAFAAGAMIYVVAAELLPSVSGAQRSAPGTAAFALGFVLMMSLDVALG